MKWRHFVYTKKSEDRFLNKIGKTFGKTKPVLIAYGDWSRQTQMKHFMPTVGVGLRKVIAKRFQTVSINEFRTSKLCCRCSKELSHLKVKQGGNQLKTKVYRCLVCKGCVSFDSKKNVFVTRDLNFVTRDLNSALNICNLAKIWLERRERPKEFTRETWTPQSSYNFAEKEKTPCGADLHSRRKEKKLRVNQCWYYGSLT